MPRLGVARCLSAVPLGYRTFSLPYVRCSGGLVVSLEQFTELTQGVNFDRVRLADHVLAQLLTVRSNFSG
jgi:hypothetical protein